MEGMRSGFIGWNVTKVNIYCWKACSSCDLVFHENICYGRTCLVGEHVLQVCAKASII